MGHHHPVRARPGEEAREDSRAGWAIWYFFGEDERGEYLDYYASHRMTNDRHNRIREDDTEEYLATVSTMRTASQNPEEDALLAAEYLEENRRVTKMLQEKGFGIEGDEPGSVQINRYLALGVDVANRT